MEISFDELPEEIQAIYTEDKPKRIVKAINGYRVYLEEAADVWKRNPMTNEWEYEVVYL